ncbi:MAG: hypothetical protein PSV23_14275 [Brevundimonas sp.]|uniref:hypothetical protein n=1 Tax=Brevundimonas sp. TaxID=1871086 RepID=UPI0024885E86|nr:hypothetical protein [Brevundimonas sp.]MDI1327953.1 hypothetical protein [Brevundimonas sp.]
MSVTYPVDPLKPYGDRVEVPAFAPREDLSPRLSGATDEPFVPVYARRGKAARGGGKIRTWMILAPVGVLVLGGLGAMMMMNGEETAAPLAEPAVTAPVVAATPLVAAASPAASVSTPAPVRAVAAPAPVLRPTTPVRRAVTPAPAPRATAPTASQTPAAPVARVVTPTPATSSTSTLNTAPAPAATVTPTPAPAQPPAPIIVVAPLD